LRDTGLEDDGHIARPTEIAINQFSMRIHKAEFNREPPFWAPQNVQCLISEHDTQMIEFDEPARSTVSDQTALAR
jgi:hypothetical protein